MYALLTFLSQTFKTTGRATLCATRVTDTTDSAAAAAAADIPVLSSFTGTGLRTGLLLWFSLQQNAFTTDTFVVAKSQHTAICKNQIKPRKDAGESHCHSC